MVGKLLRYLKNGIKYVKTGGVVNVTITPIKYENLLSGRKILVTGGSSGFGLAMAKKFISEGATVVITGRNEDKLNKAVDEINSKNLKSLDWDLTDFETLESKLQDVNTLSGGSIDTYVNNAGVWMPFQDGNVNQTDWDKVVNTNLKSLFFLMQAEANLMVSTNTKGKIINTTSVEGIRTDFNPYSASKWGANDITQGLAKKLAPKGIIVNAIAPGVALTDINMALKQQSKDNEYYSGHRTGRFTRVEEVAELATFLASHAADNIVGQVIAIDGGWTIR